MAGVWQADDVIRAGQAVPDGLVSDSISGRADIVIQLSVCIWA